MASDPEICFGLMIPWDTLLLDEVSEQFVIGFQLINAVP